MDFLWGSLTLTNHTRLVIYTKYTVVYMFRVHVVLQSSGVGDEFTDSDKLVEM